MISKSLLTGAAAKPQVGVANRSKVRVGKPIQKALTLGILLFLGVEAVHIRVLTAAQSARIRRRLVGKKGWESCFEDKIDRWVPRAERPKKEHSLEAINEDTELELAAGEKLNYTAKKYTPKKKAAGILVDKNHVKVVSAAKSNDEFESADEEFKKALGENRSITKKDDNPEAQQTVPTNPHRIRHRTRRQTCDGESALNRLMATHNHKLRKEDPDAVIKPFDLAGFKQAPKASHASDATPREQPVTTASTPPVSPPRPIPEKEADQEDQRGNGRTLSQVFSDCFGCLRYIGGKGSAEKTEPLLSTET